MQKINKKPKTFLFHDQISFVFHHDVNNANQVEKESKNNYKKTHPIKSYKIPFFIEQFRIT